MKKGKAESAAPEEMRLEYDFSGKQGARGKYYRSYREGHSVRIHKPDGSIRVQYFKLEDGAVMLEPDVKRHFPDSRSVNKALRSLIAGLPSKRPRRVANHARHSAGEKHRV
jgi:hypothetical protein